MKNNNNLLAGLNLNHETQSFGSEDDARTYDFRLEAILEQEKTKKSSYQIAKALTELFIELPDDGYKETL